MTMAPLQMLSGHRAFQAESVVLIMLRLPPAMDRVMNQFEFEIQVPIAEYTWVFYALVL